MRRFAWPSLFLYVISTKKSMCIQSHLPVQIMIAESTCNDDFNVYCRQLAPGTVSLRADRAQRDDSKQCANSNG